ncbi:DNA repair protein-like protein RAD1 [Kalaharituber pfeilii]|nr:DNA repair protein-like protein RAD1 [Kalaharituber pfeilii]
MSVTTPVKISLPLTYQQDLFNEIKEEDGLVILARGLGVARIVTSLLHTYDVAGDNLVIILGADERENERIGESLVEQAAITKVSKAKGLNIVNTDAMTVGMRQKMYARGGIFSITSRILVVDMLTKGLINPETITGFVVLHAERVIATSLQAFILRIFRQKNKDGFIKAFSDNPEPFTTGFSPLATMMRNLFVRRSMLWPRFHVTVSKSLEARKPEVIELEVSMTDSMRDIQTAVLECIEVSISELRRSNSQHLELEDWTLDSALHKSFDVIIRRQLDPVWHRVSYKTRQIVADLTVLRGILHSLLTYDCVSFHRYLETIMAANAPPPGSTRQTESPWLYLDAAHTIFALAKSRAYTGTYVRGNDRGTSEIPRGLVPVLEEQPKWAVLAEVLREIEHDIYVNPVPLETSNGTTLIMCSDQATCRQIREYLQTMDEKLPKENQGSNAEEEEDEGHPSAAIMLRRKLRAYFAWKRDFAKASATLLNPQQSLPPAQKREPESYRGRAPPNKRRRVRGGAAAAAGPSRGSGGAIQIPEDQPNQLAEMVASIQATEVEQQAKQEIADDPMEDMEDYYEMFDMKELVVVHPYNEDNDEYLLEELRPRFVIMYDPDAAFIRRVEVYRSSHNERNIRVYFMFYGESVEERRYLSAVRKEKDAFTKLIRERSSMALTLTHEGQAVSDPQEQFLRTVNTRIAGGGKLAATAEPPRVIVDVREFRSSLPSLLHGRNMTIVPCMLTVGDYILTPDIVVERKSIKDLISSFKDGRLYNQCETMFNHYKYPMLLIEFDQNKSFNLEPFADMSAGQGIGSNDLQTKIVLLTIAFPKLRIIWSSSPYQTAEIFEQLKKNLDEPDPVKAVQVGLEEGEERANIWNQTPQDMLRAVPGITIKNYKNVMMELENMMELANLEENEIIEIIGAEVGRQVYRFFNKSVFE